jgi:hypothetical protein
MSNRARGFHSPRLTPADIAASDQLRLRALASGQTRHQLAFAAGVSFGHISKWLSQQYNLPPDPQAKLTRWLDKLP